MAANVRWPMSTREAARTRNEPSSTDTSGKAAQRDQDCGPATRMRQRHLELQQGVLGDALFPATRNTPCSGSQVTVEKCAYVPCHGVEAGFVSAGQRFMRRVTVARVTDMFVDIRCVSYPQLCKQMRYMTM